MLDKAIYLTEEEQLYLKEIVRKGVHNSHVITRARVLLMLDRTGKTDHVRYKRTAEYAQISVQAVYNMRDEFLANHSLWVGINEHTYHEAEGNFLNGSYIHFDYPAFDKYDHEEDAVPVYGRFYQLQFDGYVADVGVYIRIDSEENTLIDEKICDEFISSIIIG